MDFKKKLQKRLAVALFFMVLGILMIAVPFFIKTADDFVSAFGFALFVTGFVRVRNYRMITKNEETLKKQEIAETDERNISIAKQAKSTAFSVYILLLNLGVIVLSFCRLHEIARWISYAVLFLILIYWICYFIYRKKM